MDTRYKSELKELKEIDQEKKKLTLFFDRDFHMKNEECNRFMDNKTRILNRLYSLEEKQKEIIDSQKKRSDDFNEIKSRSWRAGIKKPCTLEEFRDKKRYKGLTCSLGPNGRYYWLPTGNIGDPFNIDYLTSRNTRFRDEKLPSNAYLQEQMDMYDYPYEPSKVIQSNPQLSKALQVFQGNSPSFRERIMREMNEEYGKVEDDGDTQHSVNHDWQNMYYNKNTLSDIPEGSIGGGKKKRSIKNSSRKKSTLSNIPKGSIGGGKKKHSRKNSSRKKSKKRIKSKKRTKRNSSRK